MAVIDTPPTKSSSIRTAMDRASDLTDQLRARMKSAPREEPYVLTDQLVERRKFRRVEVKIALLNYVDHTFRQRTQSDGSILGPSKEQLVEDLTNVVMDLEERLGNEAPAKEVAAKESE